MNQNIYQITNLEHYYNRTPALKINRFSISPASIVGLIGPNGSGKTTFLKLLAFVEKPTKGKILFKGKAAEPFADYVRFQVTLLTQEPYLMKRSVFDNISYGLKIRGDKDDFRKRIYNALSLVGLPAEDFAHRRWYELSGGEAQRVAMAARLVLKPEVLLLDEPTASVDAVSAQLIKEATIRARKELSTTLVIASHDWQWLYEICDEVFHLFKGHIFDTGMENTVFGPWQQRSDGYWEKILQEGQRIIVLQPPHERAVAVFDPTSICISLKEDRRTDSTYTLHGIVSRLILEQCTQKIVATIIVDNLPFTVKLSQDQIHDLNIYPGQRVLINYNSQAVTWH